ncbi:MAG: ATP-binding cassette domain-containing protein [Leucobacter sp.]|jgi:ABC-type glutathione transport system ATPase component|nr:ATP-binding cassette domain-containing protein [Leucobacter sp.]
MIEPRRDADPAVQVSDISLVYPAHGGARAFHAIAGMSFELRRGQVLALLGESGSGKSTIARFVAGRAAEAGEKQSRIKVSGGDATVLGVPMRKLGRRATTRLTAHVGYLAQDAGATLPPELSVADILLQPIAERTKKFDREALGRQIAEMMDIVALPLSKLQEYPYELSKGQRQRVAVMRSLMLAPALLVADEPTLGVDANNRPRIVELLSWFRERTGATMMLVSHDIGMLEAHAEEVLVLQQGQLVGQGDINMIFRNADHAYVQQLAAALRVTAYDEVAED